MDSTWPVDEVIADWNVAGTNVLTKDSKECSGWIYLKSIVSQEFYGTAQFTYYRFVEVGLSTITPVGLRKHVLCHEIGHGLGIPHTTKDSCMTVLQGVYPPNPTVADLQLAGSKLWDWNISSRQAEGH